MSEVEPDNTITVTLGPETESPRGWVYQVHVSGHCRPETTHQVSLSHHDYEHWCGGVEPPSRVVARAVQLAATALADALPPRFDLSQMRRRIDRFDEHMRGR